ncbi:MAG TPA: endonuclease domain-containing protein [Xanthobacteraceae bacterium]|nr:endonuclease domain-containing protein [Xanthobacteraceae bacterium]
MPNAQCGDCCALFAKAAYPFRRQSPLGPYIADFVRLGGRLVIEVDGGQHGFDSKIKLDEARKRWLEAQGFRVLRFWNNEVLKEPQGCHTVIASEIENRRLKKADKR